MFLYFHCTRTCFLFLALLLSLLIPAILSEYSQGIHHIVTNRVISNQIDKLNIGSSPSHPQFRTQSFLALCPSGT